ncbi:hypothetical protein GLOIN_2v1469926 [Rhizophagus irregularis DAOM 181602=DAOM 197198]|uniref:Uncharacterized protein n=1 Tax=Rhizophagus irregularis (strain DAOM 181602 / DAOM 197198 / MUCL 43194) TaxID=747089 RepID=A0A2P4QYD1_RHIID|nr:hypothetical protein GLOIN_2v1469926 [Rhizophagus irregularis DAOM 181602=DAOM 197198]POG82656.1 hypothetical protein GLOIN_2v1469926 [Rhizophagus irregularis DAOM 181602=DAOM 197198]|eukprot:XP_025189522.1 hypothetical protein GLOIN_2v1469926 [Rhizophagus irregularis DAOM 181602=DAOM 197198]
MVFQFTLPEIINEKPEPLRELNSNIQLFGMSQVIHETIWKFNKVFEDLLAFRLNEKGELEYNKNFDFTAVDLEISKQINFGCKLPPPNVVILEPSGSPNDNNEILRATEMYKKDFLLNENDFLDICADEAIFRRLIKCRNKSENIRPILGQWHTSKDMMSALLILFSSYGIYDLTTALGVKFLDKLAAVVDYRSTRRVLELIWTAVEKYPQLEQKLHHCASINLAREGHYPAYDEALETHGVAYIKQNITGNSCNQENLELQIRATQEERERIDTLLNEFLDTHTYYRKDHNTNNRIDPLWKLSHDLLEAFKMDNAIDHDLFKKNSPPQLNQEGLMKINQAYEDGLGRIKKIYRQEVIKIEAINTKGRRKLSVMKTKVSDLSKNKKSRKKNAPTIPEGDNEGSSQLARVLQTIQFNEQDSQSVLKDKNINPKRKCIELPENQENVESQPPLKRQRVVTTEEEKEILKCLLQKKIMPSENEINEVLTKLPQSWNIQCIKRYWSNNRCKEN